MTSPWLLACLPLPLTLPGRRPRRPLSSQTPASASPRFPFPATTTTTTGTTETLDISARQLRTLPAATISSPRPREAAPRPSSILATSRRCYAHQHPIPPFSWRPKMGSPTAAPMRMRPRTPSTFRPSSYLPARSSRYVCRLACPVPPPRDGELGSGPLTSSRSPTEHRPAARPPLQTQLHKRSTPDLPRTAPAATTRPARVPADSDL